MKTNSLRMSHLLRFKGFTEPFLQTSNSKISLFHLFPFTGIHKSV